MLLVVSNGGMGWKWWGKLKGDDGGVVEGVVGWAGGGVVDGVRGGSVGRGAVTELLTIDSLSLQYGMCQQQ